MMDAEKIKDLLRSGTNVTICTKKYSWYDLNDFVIAAKEGKAILSLKGFEWISYGIIGSLCSYAEGHITLLDEL